MTAYRHVDYHWDDTAAAALDPVARLIYRSNLLGSDLRVTNTGGGNTSAKLAGADPLTGATVPVLWVKGSGGDLRTGTRANFASLYQARLEELRERYRSRPDRGLKTPAEDEMPGLYPYATFAGNPCAPSIDTPLHGFLPGRHVDHLHPNAIIAIAASARCEELTREIFGDRMAYVPWMRPGLELGLSMQQIAAANPAAHAIMMGQHGFISWDDDDKACYVHTLDCIERAATFVEKKYAEKGGDAAAFGGARHAGPDETGRRRILAAILPWLRGQLSGGKRLIATVQDDAPILRFVNSRDAARLAAMGTSCPDHFLRTKIKPMFVDWDPASADVAELRKLLEAGLPQYREEYAAYYRAHRRPDSPAMRDPNPRVILIPGLGMIAWGKDKSESRVTAEFYNCAVEVIRGAEAIDRYVALPAQEAFDIEYWQLEEAKLRRMPAEKELARQVVIVVGAGSGIGRETALRIAREGAHVVAVDRDEAAAQATAREITQKHGVGIGVAGTGPSGCGPALPAAGDITDRASIRRMLDLVILAYGGFDSICVTAGIFVPSDTNGRIPDEKWAATFAINVTGSYVVGDEAARTWREQGLPGNLVLTTSANAVVSKKGSTAYDVSKAAANHLVRELAVELAPLVRVNGVAPATVVQGSAMFPRDRVVSSLAKYGLPHDASDATGVLVARLAQFYADRTLLKSPITPADQAEAYFILLGGRLGKTTGQVIAVDGGLHEAFLR
ncbi:MAG TPA: bifunctional rhamnulose-1-phosphate aldolase/short-chain dehydrogenase [Candidatus Didemnitutus sp.]|jgi:rhamnulose-1-phosphate aldolase/alcohol dehydrogenase